MYFYKDFEKDYNGVRAMLEKFGPMPNRLIKKLALKKPLRINERNTKKLLAQMQRNRELVEGKYGFSALSKGDDMSKDLLTALWLFCCSDGTDLRNCYVCNGLDSKLLTYVTGTTTVVITAIKSSLDYYQLRDLDKSGEDIVVIAIVPDGSGDDIVNKAPAVKMPVKYVSARYVNGLLTDPEFHDIRKKKQ